MFEVCIALSAAGLLLACLFPRKARAQKNDRPFDPVLDVLPLPVLRIDADNMQLLSVNAACARKLNAACAPGASLTECFAGRQEVEHFLRDACKRRLPEQVKAESSLRVELSEELPCTWKGLAGSPLRVMLTLFLIEKEPFGPITLYISLDPNASVSAGSLRRCFDAIPEILFFKDKAGRILLCNSSFCAMSGHSLEDVVGKTVPELRLTPSLDALLCAHDDNVMESGLPFFSEMTVFTEEGAVLSFENHRYPDQQPDGPLQGVFGMCRDITLSKATAAALQRQGDLLQAANDAALMLFSDDEELDDLARKVLAIIGGLAGADRAEIWRNHGSSDEGLLCTQVYTWTRDNSPNYLSSYASTALYSAHLPGWEEELSSGRSINTMTRDLTPQELEHMRQQQMGAGLVVPILFRSTFWGFICLSVKGDEHDWGRAEEATLRSVGLLLAATMQRRNILSALAESEQRFRDVTMAAGEIIWELDAQGYFSYISERVFALTGYLPEEVRGMRWEDFAIDEAGEETTGRMFQASVPTGSFRAFEHRIRGKNGAPIWLFTSGKLLTGPEGIAGLRGTSLDVSHDKQTAENLNTTLKALEHANRELEISAERAHTLARKAESASKAKSEFLANMSHEIRTPLNAIIGLAYLMKKNGLTRKQDDYVNKIHGAGVSLLGVVNDVLDFSKIESGKLSIENLPFALPDFFENLASIIGERAERQGLDVGFLIEKNVPQRLIGDPLRLGQIFINLVGNAVKFTEKGGISLRCRLEKLEDGKARLRFTIRDTGIGIPEERQNLLFQSFSQVDSSITRKYGGSGLGLVITKNLLELAGGSLSLESAQGQGTTVTVRMPLELDANAPAAHQDQPDPVAGLRVTLVDPSDMQRALVLAMLKDMGCEAAAFSSLEQLAELVSGAEGMPAPQALILPLRLLEAEAAQSMLRQCRENDLAAGMQLVAVTPFGYDASIEEKEEPDDAIRPFASISRPVLSYHLHACLRAIALGEEMRENEESAAPGGGPTVPYLPDNRILLVEDNVINQQIATELLRDTGACVDVAENGRIAVEMLQQAGPGGYDLVFMDLQMPEMDGFTATEIIRDDLGLESLPVIAMTAHATVDERKRCLEVGMNEHIAKPIDVAALYDTLRLWLKSPQKTQDGPPQANPIDDSPLPELLSLEVEDALARRHGDVRSYKAALLAFYLMHAGDEKEYAAALKAGDGARAFAVVDSVRRDALAVGAKRLAGVCESLLLDIGGALPNKGPQEAPPLLEPALAARLAGHSFITELPAVIGMLEFLFPAPASSPLGACSVEDKRQILQAELGPLNFMLAKQETSARTLFNQLRSLIRTVDVGAADKAGKAIALSDYHSALSVLQPLEKSLGPA